MSPDQGSWAHRALEALARRRRADASALGPLPDSVRTRLREEVERHRSAAASNPGPAEGFREAGGGWVGWRDVFRWVALSVATVVVALMVIFVPSRQAMRVARLESPPPPAAVPPSAVPALSKAAADSAVRGTAPSGVPAAPAVGGRPEESREGEGATRTSRAAPAPARRLTAERGATAAPVPLTASAQWVRRQYVVADEKVAGALPLLRRFEVVRMADRVEVRDEDGSVYAGKVTRAAEGDAWLLEAGGVNLRLASAVTITGRFAPDPGGEPGLGQAPERSNAFLEMPVVGTVRIGSTNLEWTARPAP